MKKIKVLLSTLLAAVVLFSAGFVIVSAEEANDLNLKEDKISPSYIPLSINLSPQNVNQSGVRSYTVRPRINWYDGVSNRFTVSYRNAYGELQLSRTFTSYNATVTPTTYSLTRDQTVFSERHFAQVTSNQGTASMSGIITIERN